MIFFSILNGIFLRTYHQPKVGHGTNVYRSQRL